MRTFLIATLLCAFGMIFPSAHGQETDALKKTFLENKAKAEKGDAVAQFNLGACYNKGQGVERDYVEAVKWYRKAAEQGEAKAQSDLGTCYKNGQGVEKDYAEAVKWYRKAAEQNNATAQSNLGRCYAHGEGVEKDYAEAYAWLNLAAKINEDAAKVRDALEKKMSPQQVGEAQKRTMELRALIDAKLKSGGKAQPSLP